jgi:protein-S-isoprenylcysteine O-methyltransferase Ste14
MSLALRNFLFTVVVPGTGGVLLPWWLLTRGDATPEPRAWLFLSLSLLEYAAAAAILFHLLVIGYEEPRLRRTFGERYEAYRRVVSRWVPRPPRAEPT